MAEQPTSRRAKPLGKPVQWSEADLDRLSAVGPEDVALAGELWSTHAPAPLKRLLDAEEEPEADG